MVGDSARFDQWKGPNWKEEPRNHPSVHQNGREIIQMFLQKKHEDVFVRKLQQFVWRCRHKLTVGLKIGILDPGSQNIFLDVSNLHLLKSIYIWWTKSCTTWDGENPIPINNGIIIIQLAMIDKNPTFFYPIIQWHLPTKHQAATKNHRAARPYRIVVVPGEPSTLGLKPWEKQPLNMLFMFLYPGYFCEIKL